MNNLSSTSSVSKPPSVYLVGKPSNIYQGNSYEFVFHIVDPETDGVLITVDWGDRYPSKSSFVPSGSYITQGYRWDSNGIYIIKVMAEDKKGAKTSWQEIAQIKVKNLSVKWKFNIYWSTGSSPTIGEDGTIYVCFNVDYGIIGWELYHTDEITNSSFLYAMDTNGKLKWEYEVGREIISSPIIGKDGDIYLISEEGHLYAIDTNGNLKWKYIAVKKLSFSPAVGKDGTIYTVSEEGYLYAISPNKKLKWKYEVGSKISASPVVGSDGTIYVGTESGYLYAIGLDGKLKWDFKTDGEISSSPAVGKNGVIYVGAGNSLYAIKPDGELEWKFKTSNQIVYSPAIGKGGIIYIGVYDKEEEGCYLYAIRSNGTLKWKYKIKPCGVQPVSPPLVGNNGDIYISCYHQFPCKEEEEGELYTCSYFNAIGPNGSLKWQYEINTWASEETKSYLTIGNDGTIYVTSGNVLYALNPNGTLKWKYEREWKINSSPTIAKDGTIYLGSDDHYLYALKPNGTIKWKFETDGKNNLCTFNR